MEIDNLENQPPIVLNGNDSLLSAVKRKPVDFTDPSVLDGLVLDEPSPKRRALDSSNQHQKEEQPLSLTLARVQEAPDHNHLSLASEAVKRRLSSRSKQQDQPKHQNELVVHIAGEKCDTLSNSPGIVIPLKSTGADRLTQISLFFSSPVPKMLCGPDDEGESMFGVAMEYHLLQMVQADVANYSFLNIVGWEEEGNALIDQKIQDFQSSRNIVSEVRPLPLPKGKLAAWGRKAVQLERVWDGSLRDLYSKKKFLTCGLFHKESDEHFLSLVHQGPYYSDEGFSMPLPNESVFSTQTDFDLSHDLFYLIDISGGAKDVRRNHIVAAPSDFVQLKENIFVDRKPRKFAEAPICMCKDSGDPTCGESCLNRCMFIECTPECPSGDRCTNRRFQTPNSGKTLQVVRCHGRGYGIQNAEPIGKGEFIIEYRGEIINTTTSKERMNSLYHASSNHYFLNYGPQEVIDGYLKGTIARFANHSCDPNCAIEKWTVDGEFRIGLFSLKDIEPGTELTYDYKFESFGPLQKCLCGSLNCRGFIGLNKKEDDPTHQPRQKKSVPVLKKNIASKKGSKKGGKGGASANNEEEIEILVDKKFDPVIGGKVLQAAIRTAKTSFARGSFLIRNMKRQLKTGHCLDKPRPDLGSAVEDLYLNMIDTVSATTFVLTFNGSFHVAAQSKRDPLPFQTRIALKRNFNPKPSARGKRSLDEILSSLCALAKDQ